MPTTSPLVDLLDPAAFTGGHPHEQYRWLREHDPVHHHAEVDGPGFWALTRHVDVRAVGRDAETFSSEPTIMIADERVPGDGVHKMMLMADGADHTRLRRIAARDFVPRAARLLRPRIRELAREIVGAVEGRGECDLVTDLAGLMPSYVIAELLDIPHAEGVALYDLTEAIHASPDEGRAGPTGAEAVEQMFAHAHALWERKRAHPGDDLASRIVHASAGDRPLDELDFALYFLLLIDAGGDTTRNLVAGGTDALFAHPEQLAELRADPDGLLPTAVEELLRWVSPVVYMRRRATRDTVLGGREIAAGDKVVLYYGAANRDPDRFADPDRLDLRRIPNDHLAFGGGPHFCLGAHVGRLEIDAMLREILALPGLEPAGPVEWQRSTFITGPRRMPVRFVPR
ncbi:cytochrome P450 [Pseudonocardia sp. RS11V-5]|uniref:cytochrome P450 n=1 Tax=Pseudonocardia terrae TaxID=2905831 RepID=UPI001E4BB84E|nr:cytochrome P450 [Pseudonocardia terrae]MCE3549867.1 cytochrome P450 [Pseudonocardia terrae]